MEGHDFYTKFYKISANVYKTTMPSDLPGRLNKPYASVIKLLTSFISLHYNAYNDGSKYRGIKKHYIFIDDCHTLFKECLFFI